MHNVDDNTGFISEGGWCAQRGMPSSMLVTPSHFVSLRGFIDKPNGRSTLSPDDKVGVKFHFLEFYYLGPQGPTRSEFPTVFSNTGLIPTLTNWRGSSEKMVI